MEYVTDLFTSLKGNREVLLFVHINSVARSPQEIQLLSAQDEIY